MAKENRRTKNAKAAVAVAVGDVIALSAKHWLFAMRQDFATQGGLNGVCHESQECQQLT